MELDKYHFLYNAAAHFASMEKYPDGLMEAVMAGGFSGFEALCWALETLSMQGELARRYMGHDHQKPLKAAEALVLLRPMDVLEARRLVLEAIAHGIRSDRDENEEIDEVLLENEKKTESV